MNIQAKRLKTLMFSYACHRSTTFLLLFDHLVNLAATNAFSNCRHYHAMATFTPASTARKSQLNVVFTYFLCLPVRILQSSVIWITAAVIWVRRRCTSVCKRFVLIRLYSGLCTLILLPPRINQHSH